MLPSEKYPIGTRVVMVDDWWQPNFSRECYIGKVGVITNVSDDFDIQVATFYIKFEDKILGLGCTQEYFRHLHLPDTYVARKNKLLPNI